MACLTFSSSFFSKRPAMFVANHCSWDDIPFLGVTIGWRNYKIVAKKELEKVPILGKAIRLAANIEVDRSDRRSQMATFKKGIQFLKVSFFSCFCLSSYYFILDNLENLCCIMPEGRGPFVYIRRRNEITKRPFDEIQRRCVQNGI